MASALLRFSCPHKLGHSGENSVHSSQRPVDKVTEVDFQEPVVPFVFDEIPMTAKLVWIFLLIDYDFTRFSFFEFGGAGGLRIAFG